MYFLELCTLHRTRVQNVWKLHLQDTVWPCPLNLKIWKNSRLCKSVICTPVNFCKPLQATVFRLWNFKYFSDFVLSSGFWNQLMCLVIILSYIPPTNIINIIYLGDEIVTYPGGGHLGFYASECRSRLCLRIKILTFIQGICMCQLRTLHYEMQWERT